MRIILIRHGCFVDWGSNKMFTDDVKDRIERTAEAVAECIKMGIISLENTLFLSSPREDAVETAFIVSAHIGLKFKVNDILVRDQPHEVCQKIIIPLETEGKIEMLILLGHATTVEGVPNWYYYEKDGAEITIGVDSYHGCGYLFNIERCLIGGLIVP